MHLSKIDENVLHNFKGETNLKEIRAEKNMTQQNLEDLVGVLRNTISSNETGQYNRTSK